MNRTLLGGLALLLLLSGGILLAVAMLARPPQSGSGHGERLAGPLETERLVGADEPLLTRFELTNRNEQKFGTDQLAGTIHVVSFFFASCPGPCKTQNHKLAELEREFGKQGVKFLAITCDPRNDTPAQLRKYAAENFQAPLDTWYFLTGELLYTRRIAGEIYGVALDEKTHVEKFILVDRAGQIRGKYGWADDQEWQSLKRELRLLLAEKTKPSAAPRSEPSAPADEPVSENSPGDEEKPSPEVKS